MDQTEITGREFDSSYIPITENNIRVTKATGAGRGGGQFIQKFHFKEFIASSFL